MIKNTSDKLADNWAIFWLTINGGAGFLSPLTSWDFALPCAPKNMNNCKKCKNKLTGIMIFYPDLCLSCVVEISSKDYEPIDYLKGGRENAKKQ